ncbi:MAG: aldo/keto reductase [Congregibacter sp.]
MQRIPDIGFGLWKVPPEQCVETVYRAIAAGYRHFDSAAEYGNEAQVGKGIARAIADGLCTREQLWVTSKLWNTHHAPGHVEAALGRTLSDLGLEYLDLYLVHFPIAQAYVPFSERYPAGWLFDPKLPEQGVRLARVPLTATWSAMEQQQDYGLTRRIGVCNYSSGLLQDMLSYARIAPAMLQIEAHPYLTQDKLLRLCRLHNIPVTAFSPLGALSYVELNMAEIGDSVLEETVVCAAAKRLQRSPAQVVLRWGIQRGTAVIPKTMNPDRMRENLALQDFELSEDEMHAITGLNQNRRFNDPGVFAEASFNTFLPIYD